MNGESLLVRKVTATFFTVMMTSIVLAYWYINPSSNGEPSYQLGTNFLGLVFLYSLYIGAVVLIYGNFLSLGIEFLQKKGFIKHTRLYVLCHGFSGLVFGFLFKEPSLAVTGMAVAILYALIDRWLFTRADNMRLFFLFPVLAGSLLWGYFQILSEPLPVFTMKEAVEFATDGEGSVMDDFPKKVGIWKGMIKGYQVERETAAKEIGQEKFIITFTERWSKGREKGSWISSYEVERDSLSAKSGKGMYPPYAN